MASLLVPNKAALNDDVVTRDDSLLSDRELLGRFARARDERAFEQLVRRHEQLVLGVCRRQLRHPQDVEDAFQATFLVLAAKAGNSGWHDSIANWLYGVALRVARKAQRRRWRSKEREFAEMDSLADVKLGRVADQHTVEILDDELRRLPAKYRAPLVLCYLEGKSRREAAAQLGLTEPVVKGRLERGRNRLRTRLLIRGVSLSLALGALASSQSVASAAVANGGVAFGGSSLIATTVAAAASFGQGQVGVSVASSVLSLVNGELMMKSTLIARGALVGLSLVALAWCVASIRGGGRAALSAAPAPLVLPMSADHDAGAGGETFFVAAGDMPTEQAELARLGGAWEVLSVTDSGRAKPIDETDRIQFVFQDNQLFFLDNNKLKQDRISLDPSTSPKSIDLTDVDHVRELPGIYEYTEDGRLRICLNENPTGNPGRPTKFASEDGTPHDLLITLRRSNSTKLSKDAERMQGAWKITHVSRAGRDLTQNHRDSTALIASDRLVLVVGEEGTEVLSFQLDADKTPKQIDVQEDGEKVLGIYEFDGDRLRICLAEKSAEGRRPTQFPAEATSSNDGLLEFTRVKNDE